MKRLPGIDAARGFAVVCMVLHHTVDSWVKDDQRSTWAFAALRHVGGVPAPAFMFLAGLSAALVAAREREKGSPVRVRLRGAVSRGLYVLGLAFAFRLFCFIIGGDRLDDWPIVFRVDILNCMGVSLALAGAVAAFTRSSRQSVLLMACLAAIFGLSAPLLESWRLPFPSDLVANYVTGDGRLVLFPLFPWLAYLAVGFALGEALANRLKDGRASPVETLGSLGRSWLVSGPIVFAAAMLLTALPFALYPHHDYWHSSPLWVMARLGVQISLLGGFSWWLRNGERKGAFLQLLGRHSLLAYFAHVELVYGWMTRPLHRAVGIRTALEGVTILVAGCGLLALAAERLSRKSPPRAQVFARVAGS